MSYVDDGLWSLSQGQSPTSGHFPDPFMDMASLAMPRSPLYAIRWCEFVHYANGPLRAACERVLSYFLTRVEIGGDKIGDDERAKYDEFLHGKFGVMNHLHLVGADYIATGNSVTSVIVPFRRSFRCPRCKSVEFPLRSLVEYPAFQYSWSNCAVHARCPSCEFKGDWGRPIDRRAGPDGVTVKRWNLKELEIKFDPWTKQRRFIWKIPADEKQAIKRGRNVLMLENVPWDVVQAVKADQYLELDPDFVYHMWEEPLCTVKSRGWGLPRTIANFRQVWYYQLLARFNEAVASDYLHPLRVITPAPRPGADAMAADPILNLNLGSFTARVMAALRQRRKDPATWHVFNTPVQYQLLGGEAKQLAPKELLEQAVELLLNDFGVPMELFKGNLSTQAAPASLRLFESLWTHLIHQLDGFLDFLAGKLATFLGWEEARFKLQRATFADDLERRQILLQLMLGGQLSKETAFKSIHVDPREEIRRMLEEEMIKAEETEEFEERMQNRMAGKQVAMGQIPGMPPPGAAPAGAAPPGADPNAAAGQPVPPGAAGAVAPGMMPLDPNVPVSPQDLMGKAEAYAANLAALPDSQRTSQLIALRKSDPTLHALVKAQLDQFRQRARSMGQSLMMQQQFGPQAG